MTRQDILAIAKPILFNTEMVRAVLDNRKTVTRRAIKPHNKIKATKLECTQGNGLWVEDGYIKDYSVSPCWIKIEDYIREYFIYNPGDYLYVRETWCQLAKVDENRYTHYDDCNYYYATDGDYQIDLYDADGFFLDDQKIKWHPSTHMPKEAARIFLRVTDVRVGRLQDITEEQAIKEGYYHGALLEGGDADAIKARGRFSKLWNSTVKKQDLDRYGWSANPWVWVIEFERVETDG